MTTTIQVNKLTVKEFLEKGKEKPFLIPEYQRPYEWSDEQVETLFRDLWEFTSTLGGSQREGTYFLGSVVFYSNKNAEQEIIDGQQRITSLFLLLRAIYTKLKQDEQNDKADNFIKQIEPAIWRTDKLTGKVDYENILLTSKVINNEGNNILKNILSTGEVQENAVDNYSKNYLKFLELFQKVSSEAPLSIYDFVYAILNQAILLPISADSQDTALTIFSTLNDRGLPLSDADIFKANIYNHLKTEEKNSFITNWQNLNERATLVSESIQQLFYYYMFYLRALDNDSSSTTPGIRKYYAGINNRFDKLYEKNLLTNLDVILNVWFVVTNRQALDNEEWSTNKNILKALNILDSYPNEFWKYPVINYYLVHRNESDFQNNFLAFLRKLVSELITRYLLYPTVNAVKSDIIKLNIEIIKSAHPDFNFVEIEETEDDLKKKIKNPKNNIIRMLLKILAYEKQDDLLPEKWEVEHIFPQKWQENYITDLDENHIKEKIEHIGNKTPFEKRLNIIASNGYFSKKQQEYAKSKITMTKELSAIKGAMQNSNDWILDDISERDSELTTKIISILKKWSSDYTSRNISENLPSEDDIKRIQQYRENGWI
ncbi:MAG: DUF262 domain-containing protein [Brachyspira sp.]|nr:DUF262 domain-containing protein [Brachyspira sp.]